MFVQTLRITVFFVFFQLFFLQTAQAVTCQTAADASAMNANFLLYLNQQTQSKKNKIAILPFFDNHAGNPDDVMHYGIPFLVYEMYSSQNPNIVHPYLSFQAVSELGVSGEQLINKETVKKLAQKMDAKFVVFGSYQYSYYKTMRVMINVLDVKRDEVLAPSVAFSTDVNDSFFDLLKRKVAQAFSQLSKGTKLREVSYLAPSMQAFRFYSKGLPLAAHYDQNNLEMAALWFEKGLKENYHKYNDAALALARAYFMLALIQKLNGLDYSQSWMKGQKAISYAINTEKKMPNKYQVAHRYMEAQNLAAQAMTAYVVKNLSKAGQHALSGLLLVPEDGLLQNILQMTQGTKKYKKQIVINNPICF